MRVQRLLFPILFSLSAAGTAAAQAHDPSHHAGMDSAYRAMKERGKTAMNVDQDQATHHFTPLPDGGRIVLESDTGDSTAVAGIRAHFGEIAKAFAAGDFSIPGMVHNQEVPGTAVMKQKKSAIFYARSDLPRGAALRMTTTDPAALAAIHEFLAFQRSEHHASP